MFVIAIKKETPSTNFSSMNSKHNTLSKSSAQSLKFLPACRYQETSTCEELIVLGILHVIGIVYFSDILGMWFFYDDPGAMIFSLRTLKDILIRPTYSYAFYTPLVAFSFRPDILLFGLNPLPYHIHNMIALVVVSFLIYLLVRRYTDILSAFLSALVTLLSTPSLICVTWLTLRQYLYGMLFALSAIYIYLKYKPTWRNNTFRVMGIIILLELSFMGKEQYMVLPFVLLLMSEGRIMQRIAKTYPYLIILIMHFLLRWFVLGGMGGYIGFHYDPNVVAKSVLGSFTILTQILFGTPWILVPLALLFISSLKKIMFLLALWTLSLSISFVAMFFYPSSDTYRYWFIPTVVLSIIIGLGACRIYRVWARILFVSLVITLFLNNSIKINLKFPEFSAELKA